MLLSVANYIMQYRHEEHDKNSIGMNSVAHSQPKSEVTLVAHRSLYCKRREICAIAVKFSEDVAMGGCAQLKLCNCIIMLGYILPRVRLYPALPY